MGLDKTAGRMQHQKATFKVTAELWFQLQNILKSKGKGKGHPITGHEGPEVE
jgi:hypothetical protein